jgi:hypothetical protein
MNYAELTTAIIDYAESSEQLFVDNIPTFVQQTEERIYNSVQIPALRKNVTGTLTSGNKYLSAPDDYLSTYSLAVIDGDNYEYLLNKDVNFIRQSYPSVAVADYGLPRYYALFGSQLSYPNELSFILGPTPDDNYTVELHYFYYPESIVTAGTSWLGDNYSPALLYGSLREAVLFQKGEQDMVAYYEKMYQEAIGQLKRLGDGLERGDAYRDGQTKLKYNAL